jgi:hypothetical protein
MRFAVVLLSAVLVYAQKWIVVDYKNKEIMSEVTKIETIIKKIPVKEVKKTGKEGFVTFYETKTVLKPFYFYRFFYQNRLVYSIKCKNRLNLFKEYIFLKNCE